MTSVAFLTGNSWDGPTSSDHQLAQAFAASDTVVWVDPPGSSVQWVQRPRRSRGRAFGWDAPHPNVRRLRMLAPPGVTRPVVRHASQFLYRSIVRFSLGRTTHEQARSIILSSPIQRFPAMPAFRVFYVTDDWMNGASMMGLSRRQVEAVMTDNLSHADLVVAVSTGLAGILEKMMDRELPVVVIPNGCDPATHQRQAVRPTDVPPHPYAILIGQLNERLDLDVLDLLAEAEVPLVVLGPRAERDPAISARLDSFFSAPSIHYLGSRSREELTGYLRHAAVGITPYEDSAFNRSSSPLKTLEYLSAGLCVVTSDMPMAHDLSSQVVQVARTPPEFAALVQLKLEPRDPGLAELATAEARANSWQSRAEQFRQHLPPANT